MPGSPSWPASVVSCAARPERITSPPSRVARDGLSGIGSAARRTITRARTPAASSISSSASSGRSASGSGIGSVTSCAGSPGSSSHTSRAGSSSTGRSCTSWPTSRRSRAFAGNPLAASGTVMRVPLSASPSSARAVGPASSSRTCAYPYGSSPADGKNHDSTSRPARTLSIRPPPCASHTSRSPRPNSPRWPLASGVTPSAPRRRSTAAASIPTPSSVQRSSWRQPLSAGARSRRIARFHSEANAASGAPNRSTIRPRGRPPIAIAESALVTSSGMIWTRSIPPWAKFSRK